MHLDLLKNTDGICRISEPRSLHLQELFSEMAGRHDSGGGEDGDTVRMKGLRDHDPAERR